MNKLFLILFLFGQNAHASFPEFFGASFTTSAIGNQANLDINDPSNNYYAPSVLGFSKRVNAIIEGTYTETQFTPITNITIANTSTTSGTPITGNANTAYPEFWGSSLHLALPIGYENHGTLGTLGFSLFMPVGNLIETNSGSPLGPEYVFYHSRYQRTSIFINFARALSEDFAFSLGTIVGFQASADVQAELALNGSTTYGSSSTARSKVAPSIGLITSATKKIDEHKIYFTYQQEMKSNLHAHAAGQVTGPFTIPFDTNIDSVIFYDPHTFRIGGAYKLNNSELFAALEYQLWSNYKTPTIVITKTTSLTQPSRNYENISTRNTINPRIGIKNNLTDRWSCSLGFNYHQSPLDSNFSSSGNSIDTDTFIYTAGLQYRMVIWSKDVHLGTSFEYHKLFSKEVNKSANEENGSAGNKIGAPGYTIGGKVLASTFGIKFNF